MELNRIEQTRRKLEKAGKKILNLSSGNPGEFGIRFPGKILAKGFGDFQNSPDYSPDPKGGLQARLAVAEFYAQRGFNVTPESMLLTSGTSESYLHLFKLLAKPGEEILFPNPSYPLFDHLASLAGIRLGHYRLDEGRDWQIDLSDLASKISASTKAIVLVSPNNPTGGVLNRATLEGVLDIAQKHHIAIISDEVFSEFVFDMDTFPRIASINRPEQPAGKSHSPVTVFTLNGISKTYALPGLKLGWIIVTGQNADGFTEQLELSVDTLLASNQMSQAMLPVIIAGGQEFLAGYQRRLSESRNAAVRILSASPNVSFRKAAGGFYLFAEIKNFPGTDEDFVIAMMERTGIFVHPGYFYDYEKGLHVLISFLMEASELTEVLERFVRETDLLCSGD